MVKFSQIMIFLFLSLWLNSSSSFAALNVDRLSDEDIKAVKNVLEKLLPLIQERDKKENLSTLTFAELYQPLNKDERAFLKQFEKLEAKSIGVKIPFRQFATGKEKLVIIRNQKIKKIEEAQEKDRWLSPQFLPPQVYDAYLNMMEAMQKDIGKKLYIESGYRSSAYQLYLFVFYLQNHKYSIKETSRFVALPGYSEHGAPSHQAIDFINEKGINGEDNTKEFEELPENAWLLKNAKSFGFVLSYPKDAPVGITYEPWHWRFENKILEEPKKSRKKRE